MARQPEQHDFEPRRHGSTDACAYVSPGGETCGAHPRDPVHRQKRPREANHWDERRGRRGQALVETALVLPILLFIVVGLIATGYLFRMDLRLLHVASESAAAGASHEGDQCGFALSTARRLYGGDFAAASCETTGTELTVSLADRLAFPPPFDFVATESISAVRD